VRRQQRLKSFPRTAGARVIPPELFEQFDLAALDRPLASFDPDWPLAVFDSARVALTPLAGPLESSGRGRGSSRNRGSS